jgi:hypothetical protein
LLATLLPVAIEAQQGDGDHQAAADEDAVELLPWVGWHAWRLVDRGGLGDDTDR